MYAPLIRWVKFLNKSFASEGEEGFFAQSPDGGWSHGGPFPFKRGGDSDGIVDGLLGYEEVGVVDRCKLGCFNASRPPSRYFFCVLGFVRCVLWELGVLKRYANWTS